MMKGLKFYIFLFIILELLVFAALFSHKSTEEKHYFSKRINSLKRQYGAVIDFYGNISNTAFHEAVNKPEVISIFKEASASSLSKRKRFLYKLDGTYERLKEKGLDYLSFYLPDGTLLFGFHRTIESGESGESGMRLSDAACPVKTANEKKTYVEGFEVCNLYNGYKFVFPVFDRGVFLGSVEFGASFDSMREKLEALFPVEAVFALKRKVIEEDIPQSGRIGYTQSTISPDYFERIERDETSGRWHIGKKAMDEINGLIKDKVSGHVKSEEPVSTSTNLHGDYYTATLVPISGVEGEKEAYIISYIKDDEVRQYKEHFKKEFAALTMLVLIGLLSVYKISQSREDLEVKVKERTSDLSSSNEKLGQEINERKWLEDVLKESEENFRTLAENASDGILIAALDGRHLYVNKAVSDITGYSYEELMEAGLGALAHPDELPMLKQRLKDRLEGNPVPALYESRILRKDNEVVPVEISGAKSCWRRQPVDIVIFRDITKRKQDEAEMERIILELKNALSNVKTLSGLLPICAWCKKIRDDHGYWKQVETYIKERSYSEFTHGICPECMKKVSPEMFKDGEKDKGERDEQ